MAWEDRSTALWATLIVACLVVVSPAVAGIGASLESDPTWIEGNQTGETDLLAPLLKLTRTPQEAHTLEDAYAHGQAWAAIQLTQPADLSIAVESLYNALDLDPPTQTAAVPTAFQAPLATLVTLQAHHAAQTGPYNALGPDASNAFTLGALEPTIQELEDVRDQAPEEPIFVDPLGLIILGGSGDDTYEPGTVGPVDWQGPFLLIEPGGDDTYQVPVASSFDLDTPVLPEVGFQLSNLALELGGNDTYQERTASAELGGEFVHAILVDRYGDDLYADTKTEETTAHARWGFAYLLDEEGQDTYLAHSRGIAQAADAGRAILWDQKGNDTYTSSKEVGAEFTHAVAASRDAIALLWDEQGDDIYRADDKAYGLAWNDGIARFLDEHGEDEYRVDDVIGSFGFRYRTLHSIPHDRPLNRGLGEFIDANGDDAYYEWDEVKKEYVPPTNDDYRDPANGKDFVRHQEDRKWGVFIDCQTPADADRPCEEEQHEARCKILRHNGFTPALLDPTLEDAKQACLENGG